MNQNYYKNLTNLFFDIYKEYRLFLSSKNPHKTSQDDVFKEIDFSNLKIHELNNLLSKLNDFYKLLIHIKDNHILLQGFYDKNYVELVKIKYFLFELKNIKIQSIHDKIFIKIFKMNKKMPLGITRIFEEFIKGITYFKNEEEYKRKIPIYHRAASCGYSSKNFINKYLKCYGTNLPEIIEQKKNHIFKCYVERLIYDDMFKQLMFHFPTTLDDTNIQQNKGHIYQLNQRAHNFNSCFLNTHINIEITYEDNFPVILIIKYLNQDKIVKIEKFEKILYFDEYGNGNYTDNIFYEREDDNGTFEEIKYF